MAKKKNSGNYLENAFGKFDNNNLNFKTAFHLKNRLLIKIHKQINW